MANIMRLGGGGSSAGLNIDYGLTPPDDTSKLWVPLTQKPDNVEISGNSLQSAVDTVQLMNATFPVARALGGACAVDGKAYIFGGQLSNESTKDVYEYNPASDTLTNKGAILPAKNAKVAAVEINNKVYVALINDSNSYAIYEYDHQTNKMIAKCDLPARSFLDNGVTTVNGKMYFFANHTSTTGSDSKYVLEYNPATNTLVSKNALPFKQVTKSCVCAVNGKIYLFGGVWNSTQQASIYKYDPVSDTFETKRATLSSGLYRYTSAVEINGKAYIFSGYAGSYAKAITEYDPVSDVLTTKSALLPSDYNLDNVSCVIDGKAYIFGGKNSNASTVGGTSITEYVPKAYLGANHLKIFASVYRGEVYQVVTNIVNGNAAQIKLYMTSAFLGDSEGYAKEQAAYVYDEANSEWKSLDGTSMTTDMLAALAELGVT